MKALMLGLLAAVATGADAPADIASPTRVDLDFAWAAHIHETTGLDGMVHCVRFSHLQCTRSAKDPAEFQCAYREWAKHGPWPQRVAHLRYDGHDWRWLDGDTPKCTVTLLR